MECYKSYAENAAALEISVGKVKKKSDKIAKNETDELNTFVNILTHKHISMEHGAWNRARCIQPLHLIIFLG